MARGRNPDGAGGYLTSALVFAGMTALWAVIVRNDPFYSFVEISGVRAPLTMTAYLVAMPLAGFLIGRWRYDGDGRGGAGKFLARLVQFTYVHSLIVLFTLAMATEYFLGLNIDAQIKSLDDSMFDLAARFAPWFAAYLTGFNLGRATRRAPKSAIADERGAEAHFAAEPEAEPDAVFEVTRGRRRRTEPATDGGAFLPSEAHDIGDLHADEPGPTRPTQTMSGLAEAPSVQAEPASAEPGFLPPQDLDRLRPGLAHLR